MSRAWDAGVCWHLDLVTPPTDDELTLAFVKDGHLRVDTDAVEDGYIRSLMTDSSTIAERTTYRAHYEQTWKLVMDRFPCGPIVFDKPPLLTIEAVSYYDENGDLQSLSGSPAEYQVVAPYAPKAPKGSMRPLVGETWPATECGRVDAVSITFTCGYRSGDLPADITRGRLLYIGEFYKQRSESVHGFGIAQNPALIRARELWLAYRAY